MNHDCLDKLFSLFVYQDMQGQDQVKCLVEFGGVEIGRLRQYSLRVRSDRDVVVQFGRMDILWRSPPWMRWNGAA